eukprot:Skav228714  [mRNA]  locus=scaffold928:35027:39499:+ [translate_table: standard]
MDFIDSLRVADDWKKRLKDALAEDHAATFGRVWSLGNDAFTADVASFTPYHGVQISEPLRTITISFSGGLDLDIGDWFGFIGFEEIDGKFCPTETSVFWKLAESHCDDRVAPVNLFGGMYDGWARAFQWLNEHKLLNVISSASIDHDPDVAQSARRHSHNVISGNAAFSWESPQDHTVYQGNVKDIEWLNLIRTNAGWITMSPPCPSWSRGGTTQGLACENGLSMFEAIKGVKLARPAVVLAECSDELPRHGHFPAVKKAFLYAGYQMAWMTVNNVSQIAPMQRNRWLAIFIRKDVQSRPIFGNFNLRDVQKLPWTDPSFTFPIHEQILDQLRLTAELTEVYGMFKWVPKARKHLVQPPQGQHEVLQTRTVQEGHDLPTLCAMYSRQHDISEHHLDEKGLFTSLVKKDNEWFFISPLNFVGLMGTPSNEYIAIDFDISTAFKMFGNCIATPHALVTILVACVGVTNLEIPIKDTVLNCFRERHDATKSITMFNNQVVWIASERNLQRVFEKLQPQSGVDAAFLLQIGHREHPIPNDITFPTFIAQLAGFVPVKVEVQHDALWFPDSVIIGSFMGSHVKIFVNDMFAFSCNIKAIGDQVPSTIVISDSDSDEPSMRETNMEDSVSGNAGIPDARSAAPVLSPLHGEEDDFLTSDMLDRIESESLRNPQGMIAVFGFHEHPAFYHCHLLTAADFVQTKCQEVADDLRVVKCMPPSELGVQAAFLVNEDVQHHRAIVLCSISDTDHQVIRVVDKSTIISNLFDQSGRYFVNGIQVNHDHVGVESGDLVEWKPCLPNPATRTDLAIQQGTQLASDECVWFAQALNEQITDTFFLMPIATSGEDNQLVQQALMEPLAVAVQSSALKKLVLPIIADNHWCAVEIHLQGNIHANFIAFRNVDVSNCIFRMLSAYAMESSNELTVSHDVFSAPFGLCGWMLFSKWIPDSSPWALQHDHIGNQAITSTFFPNGQPIHGLQKLATIAVNVRTEFLKQDDLSIAGVLFGAGDDEDMAQDPFQRNDPWLVTRTGAKNAKWEDLCLPEDHPIFAEGAARLQQVTRQQITPAGGGVCFVTRSNLADLMAVSPKETTAAIIPMTDQQFFQRMVVKPTIKGPYELTVFDPISQSYYKRQILIAQLAKSIEFKMQPATYQATIAEMRECVFEYDSRLNTKDTVAAIQSGPLEFFRTKLAEQFPCTQGIALYGMKRMNGSGDQVMYQIIGKVPSASRAAILEHSSVGIFTSRDYIQKGQTIEDVTTLPRFFAMSVNGKEEALRVASKISGFAGLAPTRRGLAIRSWCKDLKVMRTAVMQADSRICEANAGTIPRYAYESIGWPNSIVPSQVVSACVHAVKQAPVPTRTYRSVGVTTWCLLFEEHPKTLRFNASFNNVTCEVILSQVRPSLKSVPKKAKTNKKQVQPDKEQRSTAAPSPEQEDQANRISMLESRMNIIETKQESMESRMISSFDQVQDQLRQVLQHVAPRAPSHPSTGLTPPPKVPKTG